MEKILKLIDFYKDLWKQSKANADKYRQDTKYKANRESLIKETARKECYADFLNYLTGLKGDFSDLNNLLLDKQDHINALAAERDKYKDLISLILGSFSLEKVERFDLVEKCKLLTERGEEKFKVLITDESSNEAQS